jgi:hypothetical protein
MIRVSDGDSSATVPEFWADRNWERPFHYLKKVETLGQSNPSELKSHPYLLDKVVSGFNYRAAVMRRSITADAGKSIESAHLDAVLRCLYQGLAAESCITAGILTVDVQGWANAAWLVDNTPRSLLRSGARLAEEDFAIMIQGQQWGAGPGIVVLLGIDWSACEASEVPADLAYARALVTIGRMGQSLVIEGQHHGLACRMTPAVKETVAAETLDISEDIEMLYALRLSYPAAQP